MPPRDRTKRRRIPIQERAQASADAILTAAEQLLVELGFARMTTNRIAKRAGVNVALVYRYFAGKEAIVAALIERFLQATQVGFDRVLRTHATAPLPVVIRALLEVLSNTPTAHALHRELFEHIDLTQRRDLVRAQSTRMSEAAAALFVKRSSELRDLPDPTATFFVLEHAIFSASHAVAFYRPPALSYESTLDALTDLVCRALLP